MKAKLIAAALTFIAGTSLFAYAGEVEKQVKVLHTKSASSILVNINKEDGEDAKVDLKIDGKDYSFSLPELGAGETREITTDNGQIVVLMKAEKGTTVNIEGKEIMLHSMGEKHGRMANVFAFGGGAAHDSNTLIISGGGLDEDARTRIKDAILAAGFDKKIIFPEANMEWISDHGGEGNFEIIIDGDMETETGGKHVIKIKKHVITEDDDK
jgi:hypothetical protein